jgi:hypothetical protein
MESEANGGSFPAGALRLFQSPQPSRIKFSGGTEMNLNKNETTKNIHPAGKKFH